MIIGLPKEQGNETRVSGSPASVKRFIKQGFAVHVEKGAGLGAHFSDTLYQEAGANLVDAKALWTTSDIILKINPLTHHQSLKKNEIDLLKDGATVIGFMSPATNEALFKEAASRNINLIALEGLPRISRAQKYDALSTLANIAGYRAVIEASSLLGRFFSGQMTAAGKAEPVKALVIGAGVAGLSAIGTLSNLGAIVRAFDTREEVKEQIQSMGATFLTVNLKEEAGSGDGYAKEMTKAFIDAEMALFEAQAKEVDIIITTALIPGKRAPVLITEAMVKQMKPGSVIVDLAAAQNGNCELTEPDKIVIKHGVSIVGKTNLTAAMPAQTSSLYANNLANIIETLSPEANGELSFDLNDEVVRGISATHKGKVLWPPPPIKVSKATPVPAQQAIVSKKPTRPKSPLKGYLGSLLLIAGVLGMSAVAPLDFLHNFLIFVLACIIGYHVVWSVSPALHTPLMSVTNAISGIILVGALVQIQYNDTLIILLATLAASIATINIVGGFWVTRRMLKMFQREPLKEKKS